MNEDCPYPTIIPEPPVVEEVCYMHAKKARDIVTHMFEAYGEENTDSFNNCYIEHVKKIQKPSIETMCSKEAFVTGWEALTHKELSELQASADGVEDLDNGG